MTQLTSLTTEQGQQEIESIFLKLLEKEEGYYRVILDLTCNEGDNLEMNRPFEEIQNLLRKKKIILSCIEEIETSLVPLKKYWIENKKRSSSTAQKIQTQILRLSVLVKDILKHDQKNQVRLKKYLSAIRGQMAPYFPGAPSSSSDI